MTDDAQSRFRREIIEGLDEFEKVNRPAMTHICYSLLLGQLLMRYFRIFGTSKTQRILRRLYSIFYAEERDQQRIAAAQLRRASGSSDNGEM